MGSDDVKRQLALAIRSLQWSYAIFWSISPSKRGVLEWSNGYYNGDIKTRKTIYSTEVNSDPQGLQRSEQLRELFQYLSAGESLPPAKRPSTSLSPEDLCDTEWYYLVCMSFLFDIGQGLPGRTLATGRPIWLTNAKLADTRAFTRSLLAKSASIQTVVCFPFLGGVIELGVTEVVNEDLNLINHVKASFLDCLIPANTIEGEEFFNGFEANADTSPKNSSTLKEPEESLMVEERSMQITDDSFSDCKQGSMASSDCMSQTVASPAMSAQDIDGKLVTGCAHYDNVLSSLLKTSQELGFRHRSGHKRSSFVSWKEGKDNSRSNGGNPQKLLKMILMDVPLMHTHATAERSHGIVSKELEHIRKGAIINERLTMLRTTLPSSICNGVDKASILNDTIDYLQQLERRIKELESCMGVTDMEARTCINKASPVEKTSENCGNTAKMPGRNKRKAGNVEETREEGSSSRIRVVSCNRDVEIEIECRWREGLLLDIVDALNCLSLDSHAVQSTACDGVLFAVIKSKATKVNRVSPEVIKQTLRIIASNS